MSDNSKPILGEIKSHTIIAWWSKWNKSPFKRASRFLKVTAWKKKHAASVAVAGLNKRPHLVASTETKRGNRQRA